MVPDFRTLIIMGVIVLLAGCSSFTGEGITPAASPGQPGTEVVKAAFTRQPPRPFCEEDVCDMIREKTRTASGMGTATVASQPTEAFCGEELCDQHNLQPQTRVSKPARTSPPSENALYLVAILDLQGDAAQRQAVDLFGQYGIPLGLESSSPGEEALLADWGQAHTPVGLRVAGKEQAAVNCASLAADLQERRQVLQRLVLTAGHLAWSGAGCDWSALAQENGFGYGRAELGPLAELAERLHPWRAGAGGWDQPDADGGLVVFPSGIPANCKSELASSVSLNPPCVLDQTDMDVVVWEIEQALSQVQDQAFSTYILTLQVEQEGDLVVLENLLQGLQTLAGTGQVQPLSLEQAYLLFMEQEAAQN